MMEMPDEDLLPIAALQHYCYCPRQCALIHKEQTFTENLHTQRGRRVHEHVDEPGTHWEGDIRAETALPLVSRRLGLTGKADVVEFLADGTPRPVEYKHGPRRKGKHDDIQVAAQAMCLEEMTGKSVPEGIIYHFSSRRRRTVTITEMLRAEVGSAAQAVRRMLESEKMPPPVDDSSLCRGCSLKESCQPELIRALRDDHLLADTLFDPEEDQ